MAASKKEVRFPPTPHVQTKMPWIQLGEIDPATTLTPPPAPFPETSTPEQRAALRFRDPDAESRYMIASGRGGKIVLVASISGHRVNYPQPQIAYNVSKAAVLHMKNSLAAEWTQYGIRVNSISPGYMDTVLNEGEDLAPWRQIWADRNPMRRMGSPQELTGPVVFLCSDIGGSYINGADIVVDGIPLPSGCPGYMKELTGV
ncbi:hypothetical protein ACP6JC_001039 [Aspergillus fumigatus]